VNDAPPVFEGPSVPNVTVTFTVSLSAPSTRPVFVGYFTFNGTATAGIDYASVSGHLTFQPGQTSIKVIVPVLNDPVPNQPQPKTFFLRLVDPSGAQLGRATGIAKIVESQERPISVSVSDAPSVLEIGPDIHSRFTVSLSAASKKPVTVHFATADGSAKAGSDYLSTSGTLTFQPGQTLKTVIVTVLDNVGPDEADVENFFLKLSSATGASISRGTGQARILENRRVPSVLISVGKTAHVFEAPTLHGVKAVFTVTLSNPTLLPVSVQYATSNGSSKAGVDYAPAGGTLTFGPNETTKTVTIDVLNDPVPNQPNPKTFFLNLSNPKNGVLTRSRGLAEIFEGS